MANDILVQSKPERLRRAGIEFTRDGMELDTKKLAKGQLEAIEGEPLLVISALEKNPAKKGA